MIDLRIEERLFESQELSFSLPMDDPRLAYLKTEYPLLHGGDQYYIYRVKSRLAADGTRLREVSAEINWMKLADHKRPGEFVIEDKSVTAGATQILTGSGWSVGNVDAALTGTFTYDATDATVLALIWAWCRIVGAEPLFKSVSKVIDFVPQIGVNTNISFRYGRDLLELEKEETPPTATRLYGFGRDNLTVGAIEGTPYIEDYSWYTAQGITEEAAREDYRKDDVFNDDSIVDDSVLHAALVRQLAVTSRPTITYRADVVDISTLAGVNVDFKAGDSAVIHDDELNDDLPARVTRKVTFPYDPSKNQVELSFNPVLLPDNTSNNARSGVNKSWELFVSRNDVTPRRVRGFSTILNRIKLRHTAESEWVMGYSLSGVAVGTSQVTIEFTDDETDLPLWETQVIDLVDGQSYDYAWTFGTKDIPQGITTVTVRAFSDTAEMGLDIAPTATALWVMARGVTRQTVSLPNSITYVYTGAEQTFEVPDDVLEILVVCNAASGGGTNKGLGARVSARFDVIAGESYRVFVGGQGTNSPISAGWPNGGAGATANNQGDGGGGASYLLHSSHLDAVGITANAIIVAGAGGGDGDNFFGAPAGGDGGFFEGQDSGSPNPTGATQYGPGLGKTGLRPGEDGDVYGHGFGGRGYNAGGPSVIAEGGGGGGGWHGGGGGGGGNEAVGGAGGSSWIDPVGFDWEYDDGVNSGDGTIIISWESPVGTD